MHMITVVTKEGKAEPDHFPGLGLTGSPGRKAKNENGQNLITFMKKNNSIGTKTFNGHEACDVSTFDRSINTGKFCSRIEIILLLTWRKNSKIRALRTCELTLITSVGSFPKKLPQKCKKVWHKQNKPLDTYLEDKIFALEKKLSEANNKYQQNWINEKIPWFLNYNEETRWKSTRTRKTEGASKIQANES